MNVYLIFNISPQPQPQSCPCIHLTSLINSKKGLGIWVKRIKAIQGPKGRLTWMSRFAKTINFLKPQTRERDTDSPLLCGLEKNGGSAERRIVHAGAPCFQLGGGMISAVTHLVRSVRFPLTEIYMCVYIMLSGSISLWLSRPWSF